ncbi:MAG TPA: asparagine synthase (glutamine-hydrolyzing) [Desulfomonilaceae bacterium]|nr:asparagine synthase (glutamine-hydrolyzing) [Desulfomonilaceae bacterium]
MCGIAGIFGGSDPTTLKKMLGTIAHRGPDDEYLVGSESFCLGARRLSIIDLEGGRQPMSNETGTVWVAQNGEIYNFPELREQLLRKGHSFRTRCDTEALVHLYEDNGEDFTGQLNGMFAVAIWDDSRKTGILARDRMGKKPLYYFTAQGMLFFASEIKALLEVPGFSRRLNFEALHHYLSYKHVPCPLSIFEGISMLRPGHVLVFQPGREPRIKRYWRIDFSTPLEVEALGEEQIVEMLLEKLSAAVQRRLVSDVPVGFFLSGGIDSALSTALAAMSSSRQVKTFTLVYSNASSHPGKDLDRRCARMVSEMYNTEHHEETVDFSSFPEQLPIILQHFDEPFAGVTSTYYLAKLISKHVKVTIAGDAADELFGSYLSHRLAFPVHEYLRLKEENNPVHGTLLPFENRPGFLENIAEKEDWKWRYKLLVFGDEEKRLLYAPGTAARMGRYSTLEHLKGYFTDLQAHDHLNRVLEAELKSFFPDQVLTFVDRLSMAHSLEVRTPYLDPDFVSFAARIPGNLKIKDGRTKYILKKAAMKFLPEEIVFRKKEGFLMPVTQWLLHDLRGYVEEKLSRRNLGKHSLFNESYVERLVRDLYRRQSDYTDVNKVFALLVFQEWFDLYMS